MAETLRVCETESEMMELILGTLEGLSDKVRSSLAPRSLLVDTETAARMLSLSPAYMEQMRRGLKGPAYKKIGGAVRYSPDDLRAWVEKQPRRGQ